MDKKENDDFDEESQEYSLNNDDDFMLSHSAKPNSSAQQTIKSSVGKSIPQQAKTNVKPFQQPSASVQKSIEEDYSDDYSQDEAKEIKFKGATAAQEDDFAESEEVESDRAFDNAFKYNPKDFKEESVNSESWGQEEPEQAKYSVHIEKSNQKNPFKEQALVQTLNKQPTTTQPLTQKTLPGQAKEFTIQNDVRTDSDVGFDDSIQESHFSEEPIDDDVASSAKLSDKLKNLTDNGSFVNMASVVPNPKLVSMGMTKQPTMKQPEVVRSGQVSRQEATIEHNFYESNDDFQQIEEESKENESMNEIQERIQQIQPKWSPTNSAKMGQEPVKPEKKGLKPVKAPANLIQQQQQQPKPQSRVRPQTAKNDVQVKTRTSSKRPSNNNNDLSQVLPEDSKLEEGKTLLQTRGASKSTRKIIRPETAKPKVGFEGKPNALVKQQPPSANVNDLSAQIAKSKKFQMIKKLKEEKERKKDMVVRNLQKTNILPTKTAKKQAAKPEIVADEDDFFEEAASIKGDQAAMADDDNEINFGNMAVNDDDGFVDEEFAQSERRQSVKDLAVKKQEKQPSTWVGNALGSGQFQKVNEQINRDNVNMQLVGQKNQRATPVAQVQKEQGWDSKANAVNTSKQNNQTGGGWDPVSKDRFDQIVRDKKDKMVNKDVLGFMMEKTQKQKQEQRAALESNINKLAKDFDLKDKQDKAQQQAAKGSDKVPEHAKLVNDDEKLDKELMDLKRRLKEINFENIKVQSNIKNVERKKREKEALLDKVMIDKNLVTYNGSLQVQEMGKTKIGLGFRMEDIPNYDNLVQERKNPLDPVVKKIERQGYTLEQAFNLFDDNGDQVLTIAEIKDGLKNQGIELLDSEMQELITQIDANADGVLTLDEWLNTLNPKFDTEQEYRQIMQNIDIDDPIEMEEKILDLRYRTIRLENELEVLRETAGDEQGHNYKDRLKRQMKNPLQKKFAEKIKVLEGRVHDKMGMILQERFNLETKIKSGLMAKDKVYQDFYETQQFKERQDGEYSMRLQSIQDNLNIMDHKLNEVTQLCLMLKSEREQTKSAIGRQQIKLASLSELEQKLDKQIEEILGRAIDGQDLQMLYELDLATLRQLNSGSNKKFDTFVKHFASITIQRVFRGHLGRRECKIVKFKMQRLVRLLEPLVKEKLSSKRIKAATRIQRMFRRRKSRKIQLEKLKQRNQMKRLMEEEDIKFREDQQKLSEAATVIARHWRKYKARKLTEFTQLTRAATLNAYSKTLEVVYLPAIRKCYICKKANACRQCPQCNTALYCENCYVEYHSRGHRKIHVYKRIRYGNKPIGVEEEEEFVKPGQKTQEKKENLQPNKPTEVVVVADDQAKLAQQAQQQKLIDQQKQQELMKQKELQKQVVEDKKKAEEQKQLLEPKPQDKQPDTIPIDTNQTQPTTSMKKSVKISDEGFLRSIRDFFRRKSIDFAGEIEFMIENEDLLVRLGELKDILGKVGVFQLPMDDVEKLSQIAHDKCQTTNPLEDDAIETWIDLNTVGNLMEQETNKYSVFMNFDSFYDKWTEMYELFTQNEEYQRKLQDKHEKYGALRSGEGTQAEIQQRIKDTEEQQYLESLLSTNTASNDTVLNRKLYSMYVKNFQHRALKNDDIDLLPHHSFQSPILSLQAIPTTGRLLRDANDLNITIKMVNEQYPTSCKNNGQLVDQTQRYYMCKQNAVGHDWIRVEKETYDLLVANYTDYYSCETQDTVKQVCMCPYGYYDFQCSLAIPRQCYINVTYPKFYEACNLPDSPYYMYSIPGFDPCHPLDFSKKQTIKFLFNCATTQIAGVDATKENVGYAYRDVVKAPVAKAFNYAASNPKTQFKSQGNEVYRVQFTLFDWKWLSNFKTTIVQVNDPEQIVGKAEIPIEIDFPSLEASDKAGKSQFVAGGRVYFETDVLDASSDSLTGKGFFDKEGYVEPPPGAKQHLGLILGITIPLAIIIIGGGIWIYCCYKKKKKAAAHLD